MSKNLHLVSFDVPYPPNYGGVIDVYYKIVELHKLGVEIYLHTYLLKKENKQPKLNRFCKEVFYYKREKKLTDFFSSKPFRIKSRENLNLIENLKKIEAPIIFDGLHTAFPLLKFNFKNVYVRTHNIEHDYFKGLAKSQKNIFSKLIYHLEASKLEKFEKNLDKVKGIFAISPFEFNYFKKKYNNNSYYIPVFHEAKFTQENTNRSDYILFHGDLRVSDNIKSAMSCINIYKDSPYRLVIASSQKATEIEKITREYDNIDFQHIATNKQLKLLIQKAKINFIYTHLKSGIKLKLLNVLYNGGHLLTNKKMVEDTGLEETCAIAKNKKDFLRQTNLLFQKDFSETELMKRKELLSKFNPEQSAKAIVNIIYKN